MTETRALLRKKLGPESTWGPLADLIDAATEIDNQLAARTYKERMQEGGVVRPESADELSRAVAGVRRWLASEEKL